VDCGFGVDDFRFKFHDFHKMACFNISKFKAQNLGFANHSTIHLSLSETLNTTIV